MHLQERPIARRLEKESEDLPRRPLHKGPGRCVLAQDLEKLLTALNLEVISLIPARAAWGKSESVASNIDWSR